MCAAYDSKIGQNIVIYVLNDITSLVLLWWLIGSITFWLEFIAMKTIFLFTVVCLLHCKGAVVTRRPEWAVNDRPIVGILSQEQSVYLQTKFPQQNYTSYIAASYVKDVESSGARVVPIMIGKDRSYYEDIMSKINGVLFPGGGTYFNQSNGYADAGQHIYEIAQQLNDQGDYFPIFGTCLGFELLIILASGRGKDENRIKCYYFRNLPLEFVDGFRSSKMFEKVPEDIVQLLANEEITVNAHQFCIVDENLKSHNLTKDWRVTSHSKDEQGVKFIASVENRKYPFYGVQFHPEKVPFEWKLKKNYPHSAEAIKANRYFMDFFVNECRKNLHSFASAAEENQYLIYNYSPVFTGALGSAFDQCYFFEPRGQILKKSKKDYVYKVL